MLKYLLMSLWDHEQTEKLFALQTGDPPAISFFHTVSTEERRILTELLHMVYQFKEVQIQTVDASPPNEVKKSLSFFWYTILEGNSV